MESGLDPQMSNTSHGSEDESLMEMGSGSFGCSRYRRRCKIRAPCCDEIFDCRHCHNESKFKKIKDAIESHNTARCSIGPTKGVGDLNLEALSALEKKGNEKIFILFRLLLIIYIPPCLWPSKVMSDILFCKFSFFFVNKVVTRRGYTTAAFFVVVVLPVM
ncbi:unnamed protein product [Camellia sinensis]